MTQKQRFAIFGTRAPASATHVLYPHRNQIFLEGQRREAGQSPRLHPSQQLQANVQEMYVHRPPLVYCLPFQRYTCFLVTEPSQSPSCTRINVPGQQGNDCGTIVGYVGETGCSRSKLFAALLVTSANSVRSRQHTTINPSMRICCRWTKILVWFTHHCVLYKDKNPITQPSGFQRTLFIELVILGYRPPWARAMLPKMRPVPTGVIHLVTQHPKGIEWRT